MGSITLLVGGSIKNTPEKLLFNEYSKRILWDLSTVEVKSARDMEQYFDKASKKVPFWIMLDEKGRNLTSIDFATIIEKSIESHNHIGFIIGIDIGIPPSIKHKIQTKIALGAQTWPHLIARVLLIEQIYRAQQIIKKHPYHKI